VGVAHFPWIRLNYPRTRRAGHQFQSMKMVCATLVDQLISCFKQSKQCDQATVRVNECDRSPRVIYQCLSQTGKLLLAKTTRNFHFFIESQQNVSLIASQMANTNNSTQVKV